MNNEKNPFNNETTNLCRNSNHLGSSWVKLRRRTNAMYFAGFCLRLSGKQIARYRSALMATTMNTVTLCSRGVRGRVGQSQVNTEIIDRGSTLVIAACVLLLLILLLIVMSFV